MNYRLILHPTAQEEYERSVEWYKERSDQATEDFVEAVSKAIKLICENPFRWKIEYKHYRVLGLKKFPHTIVYFIDNSANEIIISAIYHQKRSPKKKFRKL